MDDMFYFQAIEYDPYTHTSFAIGLMAVDNGYEHVLFEINAKFGNVSEISCSLTEIQGL